MTAFLLLMIFAIVLGIPCVIVIALVKLIMGKNKSNLNYSGLPQYNTLYPQNNRNNNDEYFEITHMNIRDVYKDNGKLGEYLIYIELRDLAGNRKFLFNLYIPNENGGTTEIDVLMIHETGIYVFESKNYSGWIFGSENKVHWTQCLRAGKQTHKTQFYNPIMQNKTHMKCLCKLLAAKGNFPMYSFVVFSERCELKKLELTTNEHKIIKRNQLRRFIPVQHENGQLSQEQINDIFDFLYPYSQVSDSVKAKHISDINALKNNTENELQTSVNNQMRANCPQCGSEMSLMSESINNDIAKQHWKCLNYRSCGYCMYVNKNVAVNKEE